MAKLIEVKEANLKVRVTEEEHGLLKKQANDFGLSVSEYIRLKIFEFPDLLSVSRESPGQTKFNCDHDKELMRLIVRAYIHINAIAGKALQPEVMQELEDKASTLLKKWGYENE